MRNENKEKIEQEKARQRDVLRAMSPEERAAHKAKEQLEKQMKKQRTEHEKREKELAYEEQLKTAYAIVNK